MRARIRQEMLTPSTTWDNEWHEIAGPEAILVSVVHNPKLLPLQGKTIADVAKLWNKDPIDTIFDLLIEDGAFTSVAVKPDVAALPFVGSSVRRSTVASAESLRGERPFSLA